MILMDGSMGTVVNSAFTSYEVMHSSGINLMVFICSEKS